MTVRVDSKATKKVLLKALQENFGVVLTESADKSAIIAALKKSGALIDEAEPKDAEEMAGQSDCVDDSDQDNDFDDEEFPEESPEELKARQLKESQAKDAARRAKTPIGYLINIHESTGEQPMVPVRAQDKLIWIRRGMDVVIPVAHYNVLMGAKRREIRDKDDGKGGMKRVAVEVPRHSFNVSDVYRTMSEFKEAEAEFNNKSSD